MTTPHFLRHIKDADVTGQEVLVRAALNVPLQDGVVADPFRLDRALVTLSLLREKGARVVVVGHIGRDERATLAPVHRYLERYLPMRFSSATVGRQADEYRRALAPGEVLMLENVRQHGGETTNDPAFTAALAGNAACVVNDAFPASHRAHASIVGLPKVLPAYVGDAFMREYNALHAARHPASPSLFILGGAKFETKLPLAHAAVARYEHVFIGGALANDIFRARGYEVGRSKTSGCDVSSLCEASGLLTPVDVTVAEGTHVRITTPDNVQPEEAIVDAGPRTIALLRAHAMAARTIIWNGPLGKHEAGHATYTEALLELLFDAPGHIVVGGGDTVSALGVSRLQRAADFVSTAGGAMLYFLERGTLPGLDALHAHR